MKLHRDFTIEQIKNKISGILDINLPKMSDTQLSDLNYEFTMQLITYDTINILRDKNWYSHPHVSYRGCHIQKENGEIIDRIIGKCFCREVIT